MEILPVDPDRPDPAIVERTALSLYRGEVVAAPSDTVYGFLARPEDAGAVAHLARLKSRSGPFLVLVAGREDARRLVGALDDATWRRLDRIWPGPVTVVLPAAPGGIAAHRDTIALRMPKATFLVAVLRAVGGPLLSTSANRPGQPAPLTALEVRRAFEEDIDLLVDGGPAASREPSTLVDWSGPHPRLLRAGCGDAAALLDPRGEGA